MPLLAAALPEALPLGSGCGVPSARETPWPSLGPPRSESQLVLKDKLTAAFPWTEQPGLGWQEAALTQRSTGGVREGISPTGPLGRRHEDHS